MLTIAAVVLVAELLYFERKEITDEVSSLAGDALELGDSSDSTDS